MTAPLLTAQIQGQGTVSADNLNTYVQNCTNIAQLRSFIGLPGMCVFIDGSVTPNDGGAGPFYWNTTSLGPDNNSTVIVPQLGVPGAWVRLTISGQAPLDLANIAALRNLQGGSASSVVWVEGYNTLADGGEGMFVYNPNDTTSADNGGTIIIDSQSHRYYREQQSQPVSIRWFGAYGDDSHDDTTAVQNAINYVLSLPGGGHVSVPAGTYRLTTSITIPNETNIAFKMSGDGYASRFRYQGSSSLTLFTCGSGSAFNGAEFVFEDFALVQPTGGTVSGFYLNNMNGAVFNGVFIYNYNNGISFDSSFSLRIVQCTFVSNTFVGVQSNNGTSNLIIERCNFQQTATAINLEVSGSSIVVRDNDFENNGYNLSIANYSSVLFEGNYCLGNTNSYFLLSGTNYAINIRQNFFGANTTTSTLGNIIGGSFTDNSLFNCAFSFSNPQNMDSGDNYLTGSATLGSVTFVNVSSFSNSWTQGTRQVAYKKMTNGTVELRGQLVIGSGSLNNTAFVLPLGFYPSQTLTLIVVAQGTYGFGTCVIDGTNGNVVPNVAGGMTGQYVYLDGIRFTAAS